MLLLWESEAFPGLLTQSQGAQQFSEPLVGAIMTVKAVRRNQKPIRYSQCKSDELHKV